VGNPITVHSHIEFPHRKFRCYTTSPVFIGGWCVRSNGETPDHFLVRIGKRSIRFEPVARLAPHSLPREIQPADSLFGLEALFHTGKGFKLLQIEAVWKDGSASRIGQRLIHMKKSSKANASSAYADSFVRLWRHHEKLFGPLTSSEYQQALQAPEVALAFALPIRPQTSSESIQRTLSSLQEQKDNWSLLLVADNSNPLQPEFAQFAERDPRVRIVQSSANSWMDTLNAELDRLDCTFIGIIEAGDRLADEALLRLRLHLQQHPDTDVLYSDEDTIGHDGIPHSPLLKPPHSPHLLEELNYWGHLTLYRRTTLLEVSGWNATFGNAGSWDLNLRLQEHQARVRHLPRVLYHRLPANEGGIAENQVDGRALLSAYFQRKQLSLKPVLKGIRGGCTLTPTSTSTGLVSIIIPFRDKPELLKVAVEAVLRLTRYPAYEVVLVDNDSKEPATEQLLKQLTKDPRVRVSPCRRDFNFAALINHGAAAARGEYLMLLNNDTQVITPEWLDIMVSYAQRPEIGAVGANLFFEDGTIQHTGAAIGLTGLAGHIWSGLRSDEVAGRWPEFTRNVSVVTAACLLVRKALFEEVGGFQERFTVCGNDVDFCLTLHERGYHNVVAAMARLFHFESKSRDPGKIPPGDFVVSLERYAPWLYKGDPYWHPTLSLFQPGFPRLTDERPIQLQSLRSVPGGKDFRFPKSEEGLS
jgi:GT2 family glycosyltransferase